MNDHKTENDLLEGFLTNEKKPIQSADSLANKISVEGLYEPSENIALKPVQENLLSELKSSRILNLRESMNDIEELITERIDLKKELFKDVDKILMGIGNFLTKSGEKIDAVEELRIREKLLDVETFKLQEKVNAFRDVAALRKELRDRAQEFREQESSVDMLDKLLEE